MRTFEGTHRELREAHDHIRTGAVGTPFPSREFVALNEFRFRTGPLVDDLVAADREVQAAAERVRARMAVGEPRGEAVDLLLHELAMQANALAALDEAAGNG